MKKLIIIAAMLASCHASESTKRSNIIENTTCVWWQEKSICVCIGQYRFLDNGYAWATHVPDRVCDESLDASE